MLTEMRHRHRYYEQFSPFPIKGDPRTGTTGALSTTLDGQPEHVRVPLSEDCLSSADDALSGSVASDQVISELLDSYTPENGSTITSSEPKRERPSADEIDTNGRREESSEETVVAEGNKISVIA